MKYVVLSLSIMSIIGTSCATEFRPKPWGETINQFGDFLFGDRKSPVKSYDISNQDLKKQTRQPLISKISWGKIEVFDPSNQTTISYTDDQQQNGGNCTIGPKGSQYWDWRKDGTCHQSGVTLKAVTSIPEYDTAEYVIITRGMDLVLQVPVTLINEIAKTKKVYALQSVEAVEMYNKLVLEGKKVVGVIHSTC